MYAAMVSRAVDRLPQLLVSDADPVAETGVDGISGSHAQLRALTAAVGALTPAALSGVVEHPLFAYWSARLRTGAEPVRWPMELGRLMLAKHLVDGSLPDDGLFLPVGLSGGIQGPDLRPTHLASELAGGLVHVTADQDDVAIRGADFQRRLAASEMVRPDTWQPVGDADLVVDATDPWFTAFLAAMNEQPKVGPYPKRDLEAVTVLDQGLRDTYTTALELLRGSWPEAYAEVTRYVRVVVPFRSKFLVGWSTPLFQGAVFIKAAPGDVVFTFERLVHEAAHQRLFAVQRLTRLHTDPPSRRLPSALRKDPRPTSGVYHAAFVCGRLVQAIRRVAAQEQDPRWEARLTDLRAKYWSLSMTLHEHASLTEVGSGMLQQLDEDVRATER